MGNWKKRAKSWNCWVESWNSKIQRKGSPNGSPVEPLPKRAPSQKRVRIVYHQRRSESSIRCTCKVKILSNTVFYAILSYGFPVTKLHQFHGTFFEMFADSFVDPDSEATFKPPSREHLQKLRYIQAYTNESNVSLDLILITWQILK